jgi:hypothetical protein
VCDDNVFIKISNISSFDTHTRKWANIAVKNETKCILEKQRERKLGIDRSENEN